MPIMLSRHTGKSLYLHLQPDADTEQPLKQLETTGEAIRLGGISAHWLKSMFMRPIPFRFCGKSHWQ